MSKQVILLQLSSIEPDYGTYKPLRPTLTPLIPLMVQVDVEFGEDEYFHDIMPDGRQVTLTTDGFAKLMKELQETIGAETFKLSLQFEDTKDTIKRELYDAK